MKEDYRKVKVFRMGLTRHAVEVTIEGWEGDWIWIPLSLFGKLSDRKVQAPEAFWDWVDVYLPAWKMDELQKTRHPQLWVRQ